MKSYAFQNPGKVHTFSEVVFSHVSCLQNVFQMMVSFHVQLQFGSVHTQFGLSCAGSFQSWFGSQPLDGLLLKPCLSSYDWFGFMTGSGSITSGSTGSGSCPVHLQFCPVRPVRLLLPVRPVRFMIENWIVALFGTFPCRPLGATIETRSLRQPERTEARDVT